MRYSTYNRKALIGYFLLFFTLLTSCKESRTSKLFSVKNNLDIARTSETISIPVTEIEELIKLYGGRNLMIKEATTSKKIVSQALDNNGDGVIDEILFQTNILPKAELKFTISGFKDNAPQRPVSKLTTYSRFVPERTDDYAWENDQVAFRTYGPVAQQLVENGQPGGTLTSGIDAWLKRVNYPIINKWYEKNATQAGYYHTDHGEGYDPYHVGASRGLGGIGVLINDSLYVSKNFIQHKKLAEGPIRTLFELRYAPWQAKGNSITEKKRISLDLGSNLARMEVNLENNRPLPNITIGITLHDKKGEVKANPSQGWFRYWEPMDDAFLGTGIVVSSAQLQTYKDHRVKIKDQSHLYVLTNPTNNKIVYYAGFGWTKSNQVKNKAEWDDYLSNYARRLASPLIIKFL